MIATISVPEDATLLRTHVGLHLEGPGTQVDAQLIALGLIVTTVEAAALGAALGGTFAPLTPSDTVVNRRWILHQYVPVGSLTPRQNTEQQIESRGKARMDSNGNFLHLLARNAEPPLVDIDWAVGMRCLFMIP